MAQDRESTQSVIEYEQDPEHDPFACSRCGGYIGEAARIRGEYCDDCQGDDQEYVPCHTCGDRVPLSRAAGVDVTPPDEYYPTFIYFCPTHAPPERPERTEAWDWGTTRGNIDRHRDGRCGPVQMNAEDSGVVV